MKRFIFVCINQNIDTGEIDDLIVTNNQDCENVLATVANTVIIFTNRHPKSFILIHGSNPTRTRLYQMAINKYFEELTHFFEIKGFSSEKWLPFEKNVNYIAFLITRK